MTAPTTTRTDVPALEFVTLHIAGHLFGVEVAKIHDVFAPKSLTPVPLSPREVAGVLNLRGRIVTAVDARARLGLPPREAGDGLGMAVGVERAGESYGLIIDGVGEVLRLTDAEFEDNPRNLDARWQEVARGVYRLSEQRLMIVLDIDKMLEFAPASAVAS